VLIPAAKPVVSLEKAKGKIIHPVFSVPFVSSAALKRFPKRIVVNKKESNGYFLFFIQQL
jgi:hypothetical protein